MTLCESGGVRFLDFGWSIPDFGTAVDGLVLVDLNTSQRSEKTNATEANEVISSFIASSPVVGWWTYESDDKCSSSERIKQPDTQFNNQHHAQCNENDSFENP